MKIKAIIFDMDGTIVDTGTIWNEATRKILEEKNPNITDEEKESLFELFNGMALTDTCAYIKELFKLKDSVEDLLQQKLAYANQLFDQHVQFIDGFKEFHTIVQQKNLKYGVATNAVDDTILKTKNALQLQNYFGEHIYGISQVNFKSKPNPAIYLYAAERLGVDPKECIAIEDSGHGVTAAQVAGMYCIGINTARRIEKISHADEVVERYEDIDLIKLLS